VARKLVAALVLALGASAALTPALAKSRTVAVTTIVEHPALDAARQGIEDALAGAGYRIGVNLELLFESAMGRKSDAERIARRFVSRAPDVIVPISTPSAQAVANATREIPIVFAAVTDPIVAGLVTSLERPGRNITGVTDLSPIGLHLDLIRRVLPDLEELGALYSPGEANARMLLELLEHEAPERDLSIVAEAVEAGAGVEGAAERLAQRVDAIYVPTDNAVAAAIEAVIAIAEPHGVPVFAGDIHLVPRGAVAALGFNYYELGRQAGRMVVRVLEGEDPGDMPVESVETTELFVNRAAAAAMGVTLPEDLLARAKSVGGE